LALLFFKEKLNNLPIDYPFILSIKSILQYLFALKMFALLKERKTGKDICLDNIEEFTSRMSEIARLREEAAKLEKEAEELKLTEHKRFDDETTRMVSKFIEEQTLPFDLSSDTITFDQIKSLSIEQLEYLIITLTKCKPEQTLCDVFKIQDIYIKFDDTPRTDGLPDYCPDPRSICCHASVPIFSTLVKQISYHSDTGQRYCTLDKTFHLTPDGYRLKLISILGFKFCPKCGPFTHSKYEKCMKDVTCKFCRKTGFHETKDCPDMFCSWCKKQGHIIDRCKFVPICTYCCKFGHIMSYCTEIPCYTCSKSKLECKCKSTHSRTTHGRKY